MNNFQKSANVRKKKGRECRNNFLIFLNHEFLRRKRDGHNCLNVENLFLLFLP